MKRNSSFRRSQKKVSFFTDVLTDWFNLYGRNFPWRTETDPYKLMIAEIMLQRTRAQQVVPVYNEFIVRFPDPVSLSKASGQEINSFFNRLGLYWRTEFILEMIKKICQDYKGEIPKTEKRLLKLPGIGNYIASALIVFGFGGKKTVVDSNVIRLVTRFFNISNGGELRRNKKFMKFCQLLLKSVPSDQIRQFNWALIDHPSIVCTRNPHCSVCPLSASCSYFANNLKVRSG